MAVNLTDGEIAVLISEAKPLPEDYQQRIQTRPKRGHRERELDVDGVNGNSFRLIPRQSLFNPLDFSVILAWLPPQSATPFRLCRYNGKSHEHTNTLESQKFYDFHVHRSTERYQNSGLRRRLVCRPDRSLPGFWGRVAMPDPRLRLSVARQSSAGTLSHGR